MSFSLGCSKAYTCFFNSDEESDKPTLELGYSNRYFEIQFNTISYDCPIKKVSKSKVYLGKANDVAFLPDDKIIVCDKQKKAVRIYDEGRLHVKSMTKTCRPVGIATNASGMVAVVDSKPGNERVVRLYSSENGDEFSKFGDDLSKISDHSDNMIWKPYGIAFNNKGQLVITDVLKKKNSVGIYTLYGKQLATFGGTHGYKDFDKKTRFFNRPLYVAVDMFDRVIVSDRDNHCVKVFDDRSGKFLGKVGGRDSKNKKGWLRSPHGVCCDIRGNILVCDTMNQRVCVFSAEGLYIQDILSKSDHIGYPFGIDYNKESRKIVVSQHKSSTDTSHARKVSVYEFDDLPLLNIEHKLIEADE